MEQASLKSKLFPLCPGLEYSDDRRWAKRNENSGGNQLYFTLNSYKFFGLFFMVLYVCVGTLKPFAQRTAKTAIIWKMGAKTTSFFL